jgi:hypothetical protein
MCGCEPGFYCSHHRLGGDWEDAGDPHRADPDFERRLRDDERLGIPDFKGFRAAVGGEGQ